MEISIIFAVKSYVRFFLPNNKKNGCCCRGLVSKEFVQSTCIDFLYRKQFVQHLLGILHTSAIYSAASSWASTSSGSLTVSEAEIGEENTTSDAAFSSFPLHCLHISEEKRNNSKYVTVMSVALLLE